MIKIERDFLLLLAPAIYLFVLPLAHTTAVRSIAFGVSILLLFWIWRARATPPIPLKAPFAVWLATALLSLIWAAYPEYSVGEIKSEILCGFLTFVIFFLLTRERRELDFWIVVLASSSLVVGTFALVQFLRGIDPNVDGIYGGALYYSTYLLTVIPILLAASLVRPGRRRAVMFGVIFFLLLTAYGSKNRGFWLALIIELIIFGCMYLRPLKLGVGKRNVIVLIAASALVAMTGAFLAVSAERLGKNGRASEVLSETIKNDVRPKVWKDSIAWIAERPWTGAGFGRMVLSKEFLQQQGPSITHTHNIVLNYAIQLGLLGPLVLGLLLFSVIRELLRITKAADADVRTFGIAGLAIVGGVFGVEGMIEDLFVRHLGWLFWALMGIILGYAASALLPTPPSANLRASLKQ